MKTEKASAISFINKYSYILFPVLLIVLDYCAILLATELSLQLRQYIMPRSRFEISWGNQHLITPFIYISYFAMSGLYTRNMQFWRVISQIFQSCVYSIATGVLIMYVLRKAPASSRLYIALLAVFGFFFVVLFRYAIKKWIDKTKMFGEPILLMGAGKTAALIVRYALEDVGMNYRFIGYLEDYEPDPFVASKIIHLGKFSDATEVIRNTGVQRVLVAAPGLAQQQIQEIVYDLQPLVHRIAFIPDLGNMPLSTMDIESMVDGHVVVLQMRNNLKNRWNRLLKFVFDWVVTLLGSVVILPVMGIIALWIRYDSPGPVIFKHKRVGRHGKEFYCYKFRSMCTDAEEKLKEILATNPEARKEWEKDYKLKKDPRVTSSGLFLRETSLDELPQIFNVLKGEMSLVGPRPIVQSEVHYYGRFIQDYYMVRPGITGVWQTSGRSDTGYNERVQLDTWYVRNWNIWFDIVLLWRTMKVVIKRKGAY